MTPTHNPPSHHPTITPFQPRQRAPSPPIPRFNARAVRFQAFRSRLPALTSRAACARFRLARKAPWPVPPDHLIAAEESLEQLYIQLHELRAALLDTSPAVIHTPARASSLLLLPDLRANSTATSHTFSYSSTSPQAPLRPAMPPYCSQVKAKYKNTCVLRMWNPHAPALARSKLTVNILRTELYLLSLIRGSRVLTWNQYFNPLFARPEPGPEIARNNNLSPDLAAFEHSMFSSTFNMEEFLGTDFDALTFNFSAAYA
ncbi:hypothetical protein FB451DRAFT_1517957 [Mycena latifolia]|nr:hypothetical protein FB451DRAFT_1517957 [Mycena latifolia]